MTLRRSILSLLVPVVVQANTYHISSSLGSDARPASEAGQESTPWQSFAPLEKIVLQAGDSVLLKAGDTFGPLTIATGGTTQKPLFVGSYGSGPRPVLDATVPVDQWREDTGGVWVAKVAAARGVHRVFEGRIPRRNARWPDTGWTRTSAHAGDTQIVVPSLTGDWTGASLYLWNLNWDLEGHLVKSQAGQNLTLSRRNGIAISDTALVFLSNHPRALREDGTWVHLPSDSLLRWKGARPGPGVVRASIHPAGLRLRGAGWVVVRGIEVFGAGDTGIVAKASGVRVEDCVVDQADMVGIHLQGEDNVVRNCRVRGPSSSGIGVRGARGRAEGNEVSAIQVPAWLSPAGMGASCCTGNGINLWGDSGVGRRNRVDSIGFNGISFGGGGVLVEENHASRFCLLQNDCGGIYTGPQSDFRTSSVPSRVRRNLLHDGGRSAWPWPWPATMGVYLDVFSHDIVVDSNVIWNVDKGFHGNNGMGLRYLSNLIYQPRFDAGDFANNDSARWAPAQGARVDGNFVVLLPGSRSGFSIYYPPKDWQSKQALEQSGNLECQDAVDRVVCQRDGAVAWRAVSFDSSLGKPGPQVLPNGGFEAGTASWRRWPSQAVLGTDSGKNCHQGRCMEVRWSGDTGTGSPYLGTGNVVRTDSGRRWLLRFWARSARRGLALTPVVRRPDNYQSLHQSNKVVLDTAWQEFTVRFVTNQAYDSARLDIHFPRADSAFWIDEVYLGNDLDSAAIALQGERSLLLWNDAPTPVSRALPSGQWVDSAGRWVGPNLEIEPYGARAVFKVASAPLAVKLSRASPSWMVHLQGRRLFFEGLTGLAVVYDERGRRLAQLVPDQTGKAALVVPAGSRWWVRTGQGTRSLVIP